MYNKTVSLIRWLNTKVSLHEDFTKRAFHYRNYFTPRGSIYTCHFGENIGDEKCGMGRPVLVVSNNSLNKCNGNIVVVTLSKNIKYKTGTRFLKYRSHYALHKSKYTKLNFDSAVQCEDMKVISKSRLGDFICKVDSTDMSQIKKRLKYILSI